MCVRRPKFRQPRQLLVPAYGEKYGVAVAGVIPTRFRKDTFAGAPASLTLTVYGATQKGASAGMEGERLNPRGTTLWINIHVA